MFGLGFQEILVILLVASMLDNIINPYMGYPWWVILVGGITPVVTIFLLSFILMKIKGKGVKT